MRARKRRSRRGREITDDEIDHILQQQPPPPPPTNWRLAAFSSGPASQRYRRESLGLELEDWERLKKMGVTDKLAKREAGPDELDDMFKAIAGQQRRGIERFIAVFLNRRVTELQAKLKSMGVAGPKLRAG